MIRDSGFLCLLPDMGELLLGEILQLISTVLGIL